jgi:pilus assembly protein Flp/PilA
LSRFARDERGATVVEYGLIAALVFLAIVGAVTAFSENTKAMFDMIAEKIAGN